MFSMKVIVVVFRSIFSIHLTNSLLCLQIKVN